MVRCSNPHCRRHLTHPESIIRGMGPICYGKNYTYKRKLKEGMTREEVLQWEKDSPEEFMEEVEKVIEEAKQKKKKTRKPRGGYIRKRKVKAKKDKKQMSLDIFLNQDYKNDELEELYKERYELTFKLANASNGDLDRYDTIITRIKELEGK